MTEYSSMKFAWFFLAEYINMLNVSAVATTLFFGGWRAPWPLSAINDGMFNLGWWPALWFIGKVWLFMFLFVWIRGTLLRFRYDQFMKFGWKVLIPAALGWVVCVSVVQGVRQFSGLDRRSILFGLAGVVLVGVLVSFLVPEKKSQPGPGAGGPPTVFDPFAGGYPVPPMPGQVLPPSPRAQRAAARADSAADQTETPQVTQEVHGG
jgi:NADH-quinone oxidoreductase subunit H